MFFAPDPLAATRTDRALPCRDAELACGVLGLPISGHGTIGAGRKLTALLLRCLGAAYLALLVHVVSFE